MLYQHFENMKSIWGDSANVEPVPFSTDSISKDLASLIKECCQFFLFHGSVNSKLHPLIAAKKTKPFIRIFFE